MMAFVSLIFLEAENRSGKFPAYRDFDLTSVEHREDVETMKQEIIDFTKTI